MGSIIEQSVAHDLRGRHACRGSSQHRLANHQADVVGKPVVQAAAPMRRFSLMRPGGPTSLKLIAVYPVMLAYLVAALRLAGAAHAHTLWRLTEAAILPSGLGPEAIPPNSAGLGPHRRDDLAGGDDRHGGRYPGCYAATA
jgi:hypothetical protein